LSRVSGLIYILVTNTDSVVNVYCVKQNCDFIMLCVNVFNAGPHLTYMEVQII
jgi:hypothetical protein